MYQGLANDYPANALYRDQLAKSYFNLGILLHQMGKLPEAEEAYRQAIALHEQLAAEDPDAIDYRRDLADDYNNLGAVLRDRGELPKAEKAYRQAVELGEKLVLELPDHQVNLAGAYHNLGNAVRDQGDPKAALAWYGKAVKLLAADGVPTDDVKRVLRNACWDRANALGQLGRHAEASQDWQCAVDLEGDGTDRDSLRLFLAASRMETKLKAETKPAGGLLCKAAAVYALATAAAAATGEPGLQKQYAGRSLELLIQARSGGWFHDPKRIKQLKEDKTFAALPAADFKAFLESLETEKRTNDPSEKK